MAAVAVRARVRHTSRREFLAYMLGGSFALACERHGLRGADGRHIPGEIIDTGAARGHALVRDVRRIGEARPVPVAWEDVDVAIIGGGPAGLSAGWELARQGKRYVVLELMPDVGGTARSGLAAGGPSAYPWGAHYIVAPDGENRDLMALLDDMGALEELADDGAPVVREELRCREPDERVFYRGRWYPGLYLHAGATAEDQRQLAAFEALMRGWAQYRDLTGRRAFAVPSLGLSDDAEVLALDDVPFSAWLDAHGLDSPRLRWLCDYACRDDYGLLARDTSAWAGVYYFASRFDARYQDARPVVTWPAGNGALVAHLSLSAAATDALRPDHAVVSVTRVANGYEIVAMHGDVPRGVRARAVVVAAPEFVARRLTAQVRGANNRNDAPHAPDARAASGTGSIDLQAPPGARSMGPWVVANVHLRERPTERAGGFPSAWDNVLYESKSLGYVVSTHQLGLDSGPTTWTWYYPITDLDVRTARASLLAATHQEWVHVVVSDLQRAHPKIAPLIESIDVAFWGHAMARPLVGTRRAQVAGWGRGGGAKADAHGDAGDGGLFYAHVDRSVVPVFEEAFALGVDAARAAMRFIGA